MALANEKASLSNIQFDDMCVKSPHDDNNCVISGIASLSPSRLVVADNGNSSVKLLNVSEKNICDQISLPTAPWDIVAISDEKVAVTLPNTSSIQIIRVTADKLVLSQLTRASGNCAGICRFKNNLVVTLPDRREIEFMDLEGKPTQPIPIIKECGKTRAGKLLKPFYIISDDRFIYISDKEGLVFKLNGKGDFIDSYEGLNQPRVIAIFDKGSILVSEYETGKIRSIKSDFSSDNVLLENLERPWAVCWCKYTGKLFVSFDRRVAALDNFVKIFDLRRRRMIQDSKSLSPRNMPKVLIAPLRSLHFSVRIQD